MHNNITSITTGLLMQATQYAISQGFQPRLHKDLDEQPANFIDTLSKIQFELINRIIKGQYYSSIYFNTDNHQFSLDNFTSHEEMILDYTDMADDNEEYPLSYGSFITPINDNDNFTLEIIEG